MADAKTLHVRQIRSANSTPETQRRTLRALGLGRIGKESIITDDESVRGQLFKVRHLVEVTEE